MVRDTIHSGVVATMYVDLYIHYVYPHAYACTINNSLILANNVKLLINNLVLVGLEE